MKKKQFCKKRFVSSILVDEMPPLTISTLRKPLGKTSIYQSLLSSVHVSGCEVKDDAAPDVFFGKYFLRQFPLLLSKTPISSSPGNSEAGLDSK